MGISQLHRISYSPKIIICFFPRGSICRKCQKNVPSVICNFESISKTALKKKKKKKKIEEFSDQSADAMLRLPNTSPNREAVVHRYSIKQLF